MSRDNYAQNLFPSLRENIDVSGIRTSPLPDNRSALIQWNPMKKEGDIIIARSSSLIDTAEKLYIADSLGRFPGGFKGAPASFYDYNLKPGTYYYAVVSVDDVRRRRVKMIPGENYTTLPITIDEPSPGSSTPLVVPTQSETKQKAGKQISTLIVKAEGDSIRINWVPPWNAESGKTIYSVYRSPQPMGTLEEMRKATKLAEVSHPVSNFLDSNLEGSQTLFYGVSVRDEDTPEELPLVKGKSFVRIFFIKSKKGKTELIKDNSVDPIQESDSPRDQVNPGDFRVTGFGYDRIGKGAILKWNPPGNADSNTVYTIYASTRPFQNGVNSFLGGAVLKLASVTHPKTTLSIQEIKPVESLFFAVTAKSDNIPENFQMVDGQSTIRYEFDRDRLPEPELAGPNQAGNPNLISETKNEGNPANTSRLQKQPKEKEDKLSDSGRVGEDLTETNDPNKETKDFESMNSLAEALSAPDVDDLNTILRNTYARKKYNQAILQLGRYLILEQDEKWRGKAYFYLGRTYLELGQNRKALEYFIKRETLSFNESRAIFWKNQALANIGRGKK